MEELIYDFDPEKNAKLKAERGVSFEDVIIMIEQGNIIDIIEHPNQQYAHQKIYLVDIDDYIFLVPFVRNGNRIFLKTIFPSRKATKMFCSENNGGQYEKKI